MAYNDVVKTEKGEEQWVKDPEVGLQAINTMEGEAERATLEDSVSAESDDVSVDLVTDGSPDERLLHGCLSVHAAFTFMS